jgi:hypothetical protein
MLFSRILDETGLLGKRPGFLALLDLSTTNPSAMIQLGSLALGSP